MVWFHLPITDVSIPDDLFEHQWDITGNELRSMLRRRLDVFIHCRGGLGRAGTIAAKLLVELGMAPKRAIASVRAVRPGAIETADQEKYVLRRCNTQNTSVPNKETRARPMDWFERLMGFRETNYEDTRAKLKVEGGRLKSHVNGKSYGIGVLELVSLQELRKRIGASAGPSGRLRVSVVTGDVRKMHRSPEYTGALFQVASQFNLLEMVGPNVTPEQGVTRYEDDHTQGPACAIAAGAATIYRNYFAPLDGSYGQTKERQFDGLAEVGASLSAGLKQSVGTFWKMQNGYVLCTQAGLNAIAEYLAALKPEQVDILRGKLCIGLHRDVEVTDVSAGSPAFVSQAFCSALPVAYGDVPSSYWAPFAKLVLEAAYEATMWAAALNAQRGMSNVVLLTSLGGGAFGNNKDWIDAAMRHGLKKVSKLDLDVRLVSYDVPTPEFLQIEKDFG